MEFDAINAVIEMCEAEKLEQNLPITEALIGVTIVLSANRKILWTAGIELRKTLFFGRVMRYSKKRGYFFIINAIAFIGNTGYVKNV